MENSREFYTMKGYQINEDLSLTTAMEDYLEMICRILQKNKTVRVGDLAKKLNVKPSSVSKMIQQLNSAGYTHAEKYGQIFLTKKGSTTGNYLLYRHNVLHKFLCLINNTDNELEQAEKIEHFLNPETISNLDKLNQKLLENNFSSSTVPQSKLIKRGYMR